MINEGNQAMTRGELVQKLQIAARVIFDPSEDRNELTLDDLADAEWQLMEEVIQPIRRAMQQASFGALPFEKGQ